MRATSERVLHTVRARFTVYSRFICVIMFAPLLHSTAASAQSSCNVQQPGRRQTRTCTVSLTASVQLPVQSLVQLNRTTTDLTGGVAAASVGFSIAADTGIVIVGPTLRAQSNFGISVTLVNEPIFSGPAFKSASDVDLGVSTIENMCTGVQMTPLSASPIAIQRNAPRVLLQSNAGMNGVLRQLCFRVRWIFATNPPGTYSLPLTINVTAP